MWRRVPCEQQLNMGQSILRHAGKPVPKSRMCFEITKREFYNTERSPRCMPKGNWVNIPKPRHGDRSFGTKCGNASELGEVGGSPGESCLFFVRF